MFDTRGGILLAGALLVGLGASLLSTTPAAAAAVYCTGPGVPAGCVVRPTPAARAAIYCTRPGYPVGCVARPVAGAGVGAPGVGVAPGVGAPGVGAGAPGVGVAPANRGGPVNRLGVR